MKSAIGIIAFLFFAILGVEVFAADIAVMVDGSRVVFHDQEPVIIDGRTLVPVRGVFEALGFDVSWNENLRAVVMENEDYDVRIPIDSANFTTNGTSHSLDVPAQIIGGRTLIPLRQPLESVGVSVDWNAAAREVVVESGVTDAQQPPAWRLSVDEFEQRVFVLANNERAAYGLPPLLWQDRIAGAARLHSRDMRDNDFLDHTGSDGSDVSERLAREGVTSWISWSENVAMGHTSPEDLVRSWMDSPGHRGNILGNNRYLGVGVAFEAESGRAFSTVKFATLSLSPIFDSDDGLFFDFDDLFDDLFDMFR
ncbi:MAG: stalk domain-containing protein [Defluviitaleaceae bacterium]|nr:stalk domain-containing protein [Defluviitaleaceae bacterium]